MRLVLPGSFAVEMLIFQHLGTYTRLIIIVKIILQHFWHFHEMEMVYRKWSGFRERCTFSHLPVDSFGCSAGFRFDPLHKPAALCVARAML
jgi:hypothetical protein